MKNIRSNFIRQEIKIIDEYKNSRNGIDFCFEISKLYDNIIKKIFSYFFHDGKDKIVIAAIGGYGRNEVCLRSDIDILFLEQSRNDNSELEINIKKILNFFWDINLDIGYSIKSIDECLKDCNSDWKTFASILEIRYIYGDTNIFNNFIEKLTDFVISNKDFLFIYSLIEGIDKRHAKYGDSVKLLEPNIKNSAGGLRDLHTLLWIFRSLEPALLTNSSRFDQINKNSSSPNMKYAAVNSSNAITDLLKFLNDKKIINPLFFEQVLLAYNFLLRVRNEIHHLEKIRSDYLNFKIQKKVALGLGYDDKDNTGVQNFMRDYYLHARKINRLNLLICEQITDLITAKKSRVGKKIILDADFVINNDILTLSKENQNIFFENKIKIFQAFFYKSKYGVRFDDSIRNQIINNLDSIDEELQKSKEASAIFLKIMRSRRNIAFTLTSMNELGVLGRYITEFGKLIALYQHSAYHFYTADEHTMVMIKKAEELNNKNDFAGKVFKKLKNKEILFLSILFHDIGKIYSIKEHNNIGAEISVSIMERMGFIKYLKRIYFLIQNHLLMEKIAFRRNCDDLYTLFNFAKTVGNITNLNYLYILTYADLSSVNPNVWNDWKELLLRELYQKTYDILKNETGFNILKENRREKILSKKEKIRDLLFPNTSTEMVDNYFDNMINTGYMFVFDLKEIAKHISLINLQKTISTIFKKKENYTELTVVSHDSPNLLSKICGVLTANDINIFDAKIFTGTNGIVIDIFRITNILTDSFLDQVQSEKIKEDLSKIIDDEININDLLDFQKKRWSRKFQKIDYDSIPIDIYFEDEKKYTIVDILTPNIAGLLYQFTKTFAELNYSVHFAKASTYSDRSVCSFYLLSRENLKISSGDKKLLKEKIFKIIQSAIPKNNPI